MLTFKEMDPHTTYQAQLGQETGPIVLANTLTVPPEEVDGLMKVWAADAAFMRTQPGFISTQLHRGTAGSGTLLNIAVWESTAHLRAAFTSEEFQRHITHYPDSAVVSPHVFERLAVDGICVA
jgi:heme-degrading monooxygenase HmoA